MVDLGICIFYNFDYYSQNIFRNFKIWQWWHVFSWWIDWCSIFATFIFAKINKNSFFKFSDIISCVAPIGLFLGRIANFINGELFGKVSTQYLGLLFFLMQTI